MTIERETQGWEATITALEELIPYLERSALAGARDAAELLEADASLTRLYDDRSGATRFSTTAYAVGAGDDSDAAILDSRQAGAQALYDQALAAGTVDSLAFAIVEEADGKGSPDAITIVLTALMDYDQYLVTMQSGARDFLTETMHGDAGRVLDIIAHTLREAHQ